MIAGQGFDLGRAEFIGFSELIVRVQDDIQVLLDLCQEGKNLNKQAEELGLWSESLEHRKMISNKLASSLSLVERLSSVSK